MAYIQSLRLGQSFNEGGNGIHGILNNQLGKLFFPISQSIQGFLRNQSLGFLRQSLIALTGSHNGILICQGQAFQFGQGLNLCFHCISLLFQNNSIGGAVYTGNQPAFSGEGAVNIQVDTVGNELLAVREGGFTEDNLIPAIGLQGSIYTGRPIHIILHNQTDIAVCGVIEVNLNLFGGLISVVSAGLEHQVGAAADGHNLTEGVFINAKLDGAVSFQGSGGGIDNDALGHSIPGSKLCYAGVELFHILNLCLLCLRQSIVSFLQRFHTLTVADLQFTCLRQSGNQSSNLVRAGVFAELCNLVKAGVELIQALLCNLCLGTLRQGIIGFLGGIHSGLVIEGNLFRGLQGCNQILNSLNFLFVDHSICQCIDTGYQPLALDRSLLGEQDKGIPFHGNLIIQVNSVPAGL